MAVTTEWRGISHCSLATPAPRMTCTNGEDARVAFTPSKPHPAEAALRKEMQTRSELLLLLLLLLLLFMLWELLQQLWTAWGLLSRRQFIDTPETEREEHSRLLLMPWGLLLMHKGCRECVSDCLFEIVCWSGGRAGTSCAGT